MDRARITTLAWLISALIGLASAERALPAMGARTQYLFMVDTSGSMMGNPPGSGAVKIFPEVQAEIVRYLESIEVGDTVDIITFDQGIQSRESFELSDESARQRALRHVNGLTATGSFTWVYRSVLETAEETIRRHREKDAPELPTVFYVFTDGRDNHPDGLRMSEMLERFARIRREHDYLYYVTLGVDLPEEDVQAFREHPRTDLIQSRKGEAMRLGTLRVRARFLDFGFVEGDLSATRSLALKALNVDETEVRIEIEAQFEEVEQAGSVIDVEPEVADLESSGQVRLKIINRESLPEGRYDGALRFATEREQVLIVPDRIPARFSTLPEPIATLTLINDATELDAGRFVGGTEGARPAARIDVQFNDSALGGESGLKVWAVAGEPGQDAPTVRWNQAVVAPDQVLAAEDRVGEIEVVWEELPVEPGDYRGEIRLSGDRLGLQGKALTEAADGQSLAIAYRLHVARPPTPRWVIFLYGLSGLLLLLVLVALVAWLTTGEPPWSSLRLFLVRRRLASPRLKGKLVMDRPGLGRQEIRLRGAVPVIVGAGGSSWQDLADQIEIRPTVRKNDEVVIASRKQGDVAYKPRGELASQPLSGQELEHQDILVLSDQTEITYLNYDR